MEDRIKWYKERTRWTRSKAFPVDIDFMACYYFSINLCALSSSCCCIIVASLSSRIIFCYLSSRFCSSSYSSNYSAKVSWSSLGDPIYHLFGTDLLRSIFNRQFRKVVLLVLQQCSNACIFIGGRLKTFADRWPYMSVFSVWWYIRLWYGPRRWVDGAQCKCKCWFVF